MRGKTIIVVLGLVIAFLASCNSDPEEKRSVVTVVSINDNQPFFSDVLAQGDSVYDKDGDAVTRDDYIEEDYVPLILLNRPYNSIFTSGPNEPLGDYLVTRYTVTWERLDGGTEKPRDYQGATSILLPSGEPTSASVLVVPAWEKGQPYLSALRYTNQEILCIAHFTFWGHEVGTDRETLFRADLSVNFGDKIVKTRPEQ